VRVLHARTVVIYKGGFGSTRAENAFGVTLWFVRDDFLITIDL